MKINKIRSKGFRNLKEFELETQDNVNLIWGDNAQGKTNLLEAIWLFTGGKSFRGARDIELVNFNEKFARIEMDFFAQERDQTAEIKISEKRENWINGVSKKSSADVIGSFSAVVFSPTSLSMIKDGPNARRKFIDGAICQIKPSYAKIYSKYNNTLKQRNAILKDAKYNSSLLDLLDVWDEELAKAAAGVIKNRIEYLERLVPQSQIVYDGISSGKEILDVKYISQKQEYSVNFTEIYDIIKHGLNASKNDDISNGYTSVGPHRDDVEIKINGFDVRKYGSQGQQRSSVLALKLAEASILKNIIGEYPVCLLDDVMSELDVNRQDYLLSRLQGYQVFVTCCDPAPLARVKNMAVFHMKHGEII